MASGSLKQYKSIKKAYSTNLFWVLATRLVSVSWPAQLLCLWAIIIVRKLQFYVYMLWMLNGVYLTMCLLHVPSYKSNHKFTSRPGNVTAQSSDKSSDKPHKHNNKTKEISLPWRTLEQRRTDCSLVLLFQIIHGLPVRLL